MSSTPTGNPAPVEAALRGLHVFERGWLSSNNVLVPAADGEDGALLIDSSHVNHAEQTLALVRQALGAQPLARIVNTHLHSDHCGGNAALHAAFGASIGVPASQAEAVAAWDGQALSYATTGQRCAPFVAHQGLAEGDRLRAGGRDWQVLAAPGHDPHSLMLFDAEHGLLLSADALWESGFGVVFPELEGEPGFDDVAQVLDRIEALPVRVVVPGHGRPFADVAAALGRARSRLDAMRSAPERHARHAVKVLIKYHLMEERRQSREAFLDWAGGTSLLAQAHARHGPAATSMRQWCGQLVDELLQQGALGAEGGDLLDR